MSISPFLYLPFLDIFTVLSWFNIQHFHFLQAVGQLCQDPEPGGHQQTPKPRHDTRGTYIQQKYKYKESGGHQHTSKQNNETIRGWCTVGHMVRI